MTGTPQFFNGKDINALRERGNQLMQHLGGGLRVICTTDGAPARVVSWHYDRGMFSIILRGSEEEVLANPFSLEMPPRPPRHLNVAP